MSERSYNGPVLDEPDPYHGWPGPDPEALSKKSRRDEGRQQQPVIENAADLRCMAFPPVQYVVPGYIAEGCTLLAGRPKLGKSWMVLETGLAVATGGDCLGGIACGQGDVLYLALEDNRRRLQRRIDKVLGAFAEEWPAAFEYATEWPRANEGGLAKIREWILAKAKPRLVIVDVLAMFKPVRGSSESLYEADYGAIKGLQALAGEFSVAIVVVHHTRKSGAESDPFEKVSGTLGLSGAADTTLILDRDGNGATLYGRGRDIEEIETAVIFDKAGCRWHVQGEASEVRRTDERGAVLAALEDADEPMSPTDIADATRMPNQNVRQLLVTMVKAGDVTKLGRGRYCHPDHNHTPHHNDHNITKMSDYRMAEGGDRFASPATEPEVCDRSPEVCDRSSVIDHKPNVPSPSAEAPICDDVINVIGGSTTPESQSDSDPSPAETAPILDRDPLPSDDHKITKPAEIPLSIPAKDLLLWLESRSDQPVNAKLITSHAPRHTRVPEVRGLVLPELESHGLVRIEVRSNPGVKPSRFIHLTHGGQS